MHLTYEINHQRRMFELAPSHLNSPCANGPIVPDLLNKQLSVGERNPHALWHRSAWHRPIYPSHDIADLESSLSMPFRFPTDFQPISNSWLSLWFGGCLKLLAYIEIP